MFIYIDKESQSQIYFSSARKDEVNFKLIMYLLNGEKVEEQFSSLSALESRIADMVKSGVYVEVNESLINLTTLHEIKMEDLVDQGEYRIIYCVRTGQRILEKFSSSYLRDSKADSVLVFNVENGSETEFIDYNDAANKPSINGNVLVGDMKAEELEIKTSQLINDSNFVDKDTSELTNYYNKENTYNRAEVDSKLKDFSGTPNLEGTSIIPIVAEELEIGVYAISGTVQSSNVNNTTIKVPAKIWSVIKEDGRTIFWEMTQGSNSQGYIVFTHEGDVEPDMGTTQLASEEFIKSCIENAEINGGSF